MSYKLRLAVNRDRESLAIRMPGALRLAATLHSGEIVRLLRLYDFGWSGRPDLNRRPHAPQACALPGCATPRPDQSRRSDPLQSNCGISKTHRAQAEACSTTHSSHFFFATRGRHCENERRSTAKLHALRG